MAEPADRTLAFERLNNVNFSIWSQQMEAKLIHLEVWYVIADPVPAAVTAL